MGVITVDPVVTEAPLLSNLDPYHTESVAALCERFYRIDQFLWSPSDASGQDLATYNLLEALYSQPFIQDKFRDYMGVKTDITYYIRLTSTAWNYGAIMCGHVPDYDNSSSSAFRLWNLPALSQCNGFTIQPSAGVSQERTIPWSAPAPYQLIANIGSAGSIGKVGVLMLMCMNALESAGGSTADPVTVSVYAKFTNLQLVGYSPSDNVAIRPRYVWKKPERRILSAQSKTTKEAKSKDSSLAGVKEATSTIKGILGSVMDAASVVGDLMETLGPLASLAALDKPSAITPSHPVHEDYVATLNHGKGLDIGSKIAINPDAVISVDPSCVSTKKSQPTLSSVIMTPTFVRTWKFTPASVSGTWEYWILNPSNCAKVLTSTSRWTGGVWQPTYMAYYGQFFRYWRGSFKILLEFVCSPSTQADFRIAHFPEVPSFSASLDDYDGDIVSEVISVHGPKEEPRSFGYVSMSHWHEIDPVTLMTPANSSGCFAITLDSKISTIGSAVDANIYVNMYVAAGPDMSFMQVQSPPINPQIDPLAYMIESPAKVPEIDVKKFTRNLVMQSNLADSFSKPFKGIRDVTLSPEVGFMNSDPVCHITDLCHRYVTVGGPVPSTGVTNAYVQVSPSFYAAASTPYQQKTITGLLIFPFLFWRGAMRFAYFNFPGDNVLYEFYISNGHNVGTQFDSPFSGSAQQFNYGKPIFFEVPWLQPRMHMETVPTRTQNEPNVQYFPSVTYPGSPLPAYPDVVLVRSRQSIGDDFSVGPLSACPPIGYTASASDSIDPLLSGSISSSTAEKLLSYLNKGKLPSSPKTPPVPN